MTEHELDARLCRLENRVQWLDRIVARIVQLLAKLDLVIATPDEQEGRRG